MARPLEAPEGVAADAMICQLTELLKEDPLFDVVSPEAEPACLAKNVVRFCFTGAGAYGMPPSKVIFFYIVCVIFVVLFSFFVAFFFGTCLYCTFFSLFLLYLWYFICLFFALFVFLLF